MGQKSLFPEPMAADASPTYVRVPPPLGSGAPPSRVKLPSLEARQVQALLRMEATGAPMTASFYRKLTGATGKQASRELADLHQRGLVEKAGLGRGVKYWLHADQGTP